MKKIVWLLFLGICFCETALSQETDEVETTATPAVATKAARPSPNTWSVGLSTLQWNDKLGLRSGLLSDSDFANYNALILTAQNEIIFKRWGWSLGAFIGSGRANGGGNGTVITYEENKVAFTVLGVTPRAFYRLSGRITAGLSAMIFTRNIDWPTDSSSLTVDSGRNLNAMGLVDLNIRVFQKWDFYQGIGPLAEGSTLWRLGVTRRF